MKIHIDLPAFSQAVSNMETAAQNINGTVDGWSSNPMSAEAFEEFIRQYEQIQMIMQSYRQLVLQDIESIEDTGNVLEIMDEKLKELWKQN